MKEPSKEVTEAQKLADALAYTYDHKTACAIIDKHISPLYAEIERLKKFHDGVLQNIPPCAGCASQILTGGVWPETPHTCAIKDRESLQIQVAALREALELGVKCCSWYSLDSDDYFKMKKALKEAPSTSNWIRRSDKTNETP